MDLTTEESEAILQAQLELWSHAFGHTKSTALSTALDLRLADAIHHHGGAATLSQILADIALHPSKLSALRRLMRVLTISGVFDVVQQTPSAASPDDGGGEAVLYKLTAVSRLMVHDHSTTDLSTVLSMFLRNPSTSSTLSMAAWFRQPDMAHCEALWQTTRQDDAMNNRFNNAMAADSRFLMAIALRDERVREVFEGIDSLVDVGGGLGACAAAIVAAFPRLECRVLDLPHVVAKAPAHGNVQFVAGDMFRSIPPADAVFLKWIFHDWSDAECVKILKNCKESIPPRDAGGKIIIIEMVVGSGPSDNKHIETQALFDLSMMLTINGIERDEQQWSKISMEAGFSDYKIMPILGVRSIIVLYP